MLIENQYLDLGLDLLEQGTSAPDRTGTGTRRKFGAVLEHDMADGFPLLTTKRMPYTKVVEELLWFLRGETNVAGLGSAKNLWAPWAKEDGELGPVYGAQWAKQLDAVVEEARVNPTSRRLLVDSWQVADLHKMALPPCHFAFQFFIDGDSIDLQWYQRSADWPVGVPFNLASYATLLMILGIKLGKQPRNLRGVFGDYHIYEDQVSLFVMQQQRTARVSPKVEIKGDYMDINSYHLSEYYCHPTIKFPVSV